MAAQHEAATSLRGLYAPTVDCTVPAPVAAVERLSASATGTPATPDQWDAAAARSDQVVARATAVLALFDGPRVGDESASVLLERLRAGRLAAESTGSRRRNPRGTTP